MKTKHPAPLSMTSLAAAGMAALALLMAGCSSSGGGSGANPKPSGGGADTPVTPPPPAAAQTTPTAKATEGVGNTVVSAGNAVSEIGKSIQDAPLPLLPTDARKGAGGVVVNAGEAVGALGAGVRDGLGQMGSVDNPLGVTVSSSGNVVREVGDAVVNGGALVQGLGTEKLAPLAPLTTPVGGLVAKVGTVVQGGGDKLQTVLADGAVAQVTNSLSKVIVPLTSKVTDGTQTLGATTRLGGPADGLLYKVGNTVATGGSMLSQTQAPVVAPLGGVVTEAGKTVAAVGVLVNGNGQGGDGNALGGLLGSLPLVKPGSGDGGAVSGGAPGPVGALLAPVTGLVGGIKSGVGGSVGGAGGGDSKPQLPILGGLLH
ncbi:collagen-like triple helix repeat-containing protein [Cupriavidus neocaledonicus]|uniref:Collagen, middle region n=1 Tax=Cupriavidus neocaledonicus TaxID=1040979 RepID=A0A375HS78_9BURK|nr:collagen-like triple helix repeat-containing protein [Cupriavidus neocaledonicus]SOZ39603.1 conserved hypothetical protein, putative exported protein [Cupriavidus neocaledonicus]SPD61071.1 Collagen, middle region [Cupriavidus neocaledonicus]